MIALHDSDTCEYLVYLGADHGGALERLPRPLLDLAAKHLHRKHEEREPNRDEAQRRHHVVGGREPDDEADRHEYLERGERDLGEDRREDYLDLVWVAEYAREDLAHVNSAEELHVLPLHVLEHFLPQVGHRVRTRPAEAVVVQIHQPKAQKRHDRNYEADDQHQRAGHAALVVLKLNADLRGPLLHLRIPPRQLGVPCYLLLEVVPRLAQLAGG